jgi:hypothetical protein
MLTYQQLISEIQKRPLTEKLRLVEKIVHLAQQEAAYSPKQEQTDERGWFIGFFDRTAGSLSEFPMERPPQIGVCDFDDLAAEHFARERARLQAAGTPIGMSDLLIASIALANNVYS